MERKTFTCDQLNRVTLKDYPTGTDINYYYDEGTSTNPIGRLTRVTDNSGTTYSGPNSELKSTPVL